MFDRALWRNPLFRRMFMAAAATNLGDGVIAVALPWFATQLTHDPFLIGLVAAGRHAPWALFALPAGVMADRHDRRHVLIAADLVRLGSMAALIPLALLATPGTLPVLILAALAFLLGAAEVLRDTTAQTFLPDLVEKPQLERANSALWATETLAGQFLGPPLAGMLIGFALALPFGLMAAMLALALALITTMALPPRQAVPRQAMGPALREGLTWLWANPTLRRMALVLGGFNFLGYGYWAVLVLYAQRVLQLDALGYGSFMTVIALGGLAATLVGPAILDRIGATAGLMLGMAVFSLNCLTLALAPPLWVAALVMMVDGFTGMLWNIATVSYRQRAIPAPLLGRVNAAYRFFGTGPAGLGALVFGGIVAWAEPWGTESAILLPFWISGLLALGLLAYSALRIRLR